MAREKKLIIGAINITMQPHSPKKYIQLFRDVHRLKRPAHIRAHQYALLSGVMKAERGQKKNGPITGDIFRFTDIDQKSNWFDLDTSDFAKGDILESITIPENLKPNSSRFSYLFYPIRHQLFYEGYYEGQTLTPSNATRFFKRLFDQDEIVSKYGKIDVTHFPDRDGLEEALNMYRLDRIKVSITRPNPDDNARSEEEVLRRLLKLNAQTEEIELKAASNAGLNLDGDFKTLAKVAADNGSVDAKGRDRELKPITFSTKDHPITHKDYYDPNVESSYEKFLRMARILRNELRRASRREV